MPFKQVIVVRADLAMGKGKTAAQCAHASVEAVLKAQKNSPKALEAWLAEGMEKVVVKVENERSLVELFQAMKEKFPCALIKDAGRTQIAAGTKTCFACGPAEEKALDAFTDSLKLL